MIYSIPGGSVRLTITISLDLPGNGIPFTSSKINNMKWTIKINEQFIQTGDVNFYGEFYVTNY